jgi:hypothetical protein
MMPRAAGSELSDELLGLVKLAAEPVPLLGRAPRERLARVAGVQFADRGHALPLPGPELHYGRRPLRIAASVFRSRRHESHRSNPVRARRRTDCGPGAPAALTLVAARGDRGSVRNLSATLRTSSSQSATMQTFRSKTCPIVPSGAINVGTLGAPPVLSRPSAGGAHSGPMRSPPTIRRFGRFASAFRIATCHLPGRSSKVSSSASWNSRR